MGIQSRRPHVLSTMSMTSPRSNITCSIFFVNTSITSLFTIGWSLIEILQLDWLFGFNPSCRPGNASSPDCTQPSVNKHDYQSDEDDHHHVKNSHYHSYHEDGYDQLLRLSRSPSDNDHCIYHQVAGMLHTAGNYTFDSCQTIRSDQYWFWFFFTSASQLMFSSANFPAVSF